MTKLEHSGHSLALLIEVVDAETQETIADVDTGRITSQRLDAKRLAEYWPLILESAREVLNIVHAGPLSSRLIERLGEIRRQG